MSVATDGADGRSGGRREQAHPEHILRGIDPDTLPEGDCWPEVRRRIRMYRRGEDGWRTGHRETTLTEFAGGVSDGK